MNRDLRPLSQSAREAAAFLKALAHEYRLLILCHLGDGELPVQTLEEQLGTSQSNISQHLARLRDKGIVEFRKEANQVFYRIKSEKTRAIIRSLQENFCS